MVGSIIVQEPAEYEAWMNGGSAGHSPRRERKFSPNSAAAPATAAILRDAARICKVYTANPVSTRDGRTVNADENYLRECILDPAQSA